MMQYCYTIVVDLDHFAMFWDGLSGSDINRIYWSDVPEMIEKSGFTIHHHQGIYHASGDATRISALISMRNVKRPEFCKYIRRINVNWQD